MAKSDLRQWEVRRMPLSELVPADYNPRKISDKAKNGLGASIDMFGMLVPIVWNERSKHIVGGHQRFERLMELDEKETDVVVVDFGDDDEVALNIALNHRGIRGKFTAHAIQLLSHAELALGPAFIELGLSSLNEELKKKFKEKPEPQPPSSGGTGSGEPPPPDKVPEALISCPRCRSKFKMSNNEVVLNAFSK